MIQNKTLVGNIECWLGSCVIFREILTIIGKKPYIFCDFSGVSVPPIPPPPHIIPPMNGSKKSLDTYNAKYKKLHKVYQLSLLQ